MSLPSLTPALALLCAACSLARPAPAQTATNQPAVFDAVLRNGETVGNRRIQRGYITMGTNEFSFIVPEGFRRDPAPAARICFVNQDYDCFLTLRLADHRPDGGSLVSAESCRAAVLEQISNATLCHESTLTIADHTGPSFDAQWMGAGGTLQRTRIAFVPSAAGVLELSLITTAAKFTRGQYFLTVFSQSFRSNEKGPLVTELVPDNS